MEQHRQPKQESPKLSLLRELWKNNPIEELPKGYALLKEGDICKHIYFIEKGQLRAFYNKNGKEININFSFENHFVTNLKSFFYVMPSEYHILTAEPTVIRKVTRDQLIALYNEPGRLEAFSRYLMQRQLIRQEEHSNLFKIYTPSERYHYVATHYPILLQRVSLSQLASYLGISRETISRIRKNTFTWSGL